MNSTSKITINTDGGSRGNPGPSAVGIYITQNGVKHSEFSEYLGITTNNVAEYTAVIKALEYLISNKIKTTEINFILDSELIVKQINGIYKIKQPHLQQLNQQVQSLISTVKDNDQAQQIIFTHVLREKNKEADRLVNNCLDSQY